jgi:hypothetical protein
MRGSLWQVAAIGVLLAVAGVGLNPTAEQTTTAVNETDQVTVQYEGTISPSPDQRALLYYDNETVTVNESTDTTPDTLTEGVDYDWHQRNGSLVFYNTAQTSEGDTANITYSYGTGGEATGVVATILGSLGGWIGLLFIMVAVGAVWKLTAGVSGGF